MTKPIKIKLIPYKENNNNIYKREKLDFYILMNQTHFQNVNEALKEKIEDIESQLEYIIKEINTIYKEESTLNVLTNCFETIIKTVKKQQFNQEKINIQVSEVSDINLILKESDLSIQKDLIILNFEEFETNPEKFVSDIEKKLRVIHNRKSYIKDQSKNLHTNITFLKVKQENINCSKADTNLIDIAYKSLVLVNKVT